MINPFESKGGISPIVATVLLVAFAVALGAVVMSWARGIEAEPITDFEGCIIEGPLPADPLIQLQIRYIRGEISKDEYIQQEKVLI